MVAGFWDFPALQLSSAAEWFNHLVKWNNYSGVALLQRLLRISRYEQNGVCAGMLWLTTVMDGEKLPRNVVALL